MALPDTGDIEADLKTVLWATAVEFAVPELAAQVAVLRLLVTCDFALEASGPLVVLGVARRAAAARAGRRA